MILLQTPASHDDGGNTKQTLNKSSLLIEGERPLEPIRQSAGDADAALHVAFRRNENGRTESDIETPPFRGHFKRSDDIYFPNGITHPKAVQIGVIAANYGSVRRILVDLARDRHFDLDGIPHDRSVGGVQTPPAGKSKVLVVHPTRQEQP